MVYLTRNSFWINSGHATSAIVGILLAIVYANFFSPEVYGSYTTIIAISSILSVLTLFRMNTPTISAIAKGFDGTFLAALKMRLRWGILGSIMGFGFALYYYLNGNSQLTIAFILIAIFSPAMHSMASYRFFLAGKQNFKLLSLFLIATQLIHLTIVSFVGYVSDDLLTLLASYLGTHLMLRYFFTRYVIDKYSLKKEGLKVDKNALILGKRLSFFSIFGTLVSHIDKILIWHFLGPIQVAIYSFAITPPKQISKLFSPITDISLAKFGNRDKSVLKLAIPKKMITIFLFSVPIVLVYIFLAPFIFHTLFPKYESAIFYTQLYSLILLLQGRLLIPFFHSQQKNKELYIIDFMKPIIKISCIAIFLPTLGILGMIIALLTSASLDLMLRFYLMKKS